MWGRRFKSRLCSVNCDDTMHQTKLMKTSDIIREVNRHKFVIKLLLFVNLQITFNNPKDKAVP